MRQRRPQQGLVVALLVKIIVAAVSVDVKILLQKPAINGSPNALVQEQLHQLPPSFLMGPCVQLIANVNQIVVPRIHWTTLSPAYLPTTSHQLRPPRCQPVNKPVVIVPRFATQSLVVPVLVFLFNPVVH
jgi:hypothetical protein